MNPAEAPDAGHDGRDVTPDVHIEDQGGPDQYGRVEAIVRFDGVIAGQLQYAAWPQHLVIYNTRWEDHVGPGAEAVLLEVLLRFYTEGLPPRITHSAVTSLETLRWYAGSALANGLMVCGSYGAQTLFYDPMSSMDLDNPPPPLMEGYPAATVSVMYSDQVHDRGDVPSPTLEQVYDWLMRGDHLARFVTLRRLAVDPRVDRRVAEAALHLGLLNENSGVRQFAAIHLAGFFPEVDMRVDVARLHRFLADPLRIFSLFGREIEGDVEHWNPAQCRRNGRYAIAWTMGNICWNAMGWGAVAWAEEEAAAVRALLTTSMETFDEARDAWLFAKVQGEFIGEGDARFGLGGEEPVDLYDVLRFVSMRWNIVLRLGLKATDRFYWLVNTADGILGKFPGDEEDASELPEEAYTPRTPATEAIYAAPPTDWLPPLQEMPPWLYGRNHYDMFQSIPIAMGPGALAGKV